MRYVVARISQKKEEELYKFYVTDMLQGLFTNQYYVTSFKDILRPPKEDKRSGEEIAADVMEKAGLKFKEEEDECI